MPTSNRPRNVLLAAIAAVAIVVGAGVAYRLFFVESDAIERDGDRSVPVEVATVERRPIEQRRSFAGTLVSTAEVNVSPKVAGRVLSLEADLADAVTSGSVIARLDSAEFELAVKQAEADAKVAEARLGEATTALEVAERDYSRNQSLFDEGIVADSTFDTARANVAAARAQVDVAEAELTRARSLVESAKIRLDYTNVTADWSGGQGERFVAERFVESGETVAANTPLLRVVALDPIRAVVYVTERDYGQFARGQEVRLTTDAFPEVVFTGRIDRISPTFDANSRQARIELLVENPDLKLKPGLFVQADAALRRTESATVVPEQALVERDGGVGVFVLDGEQVAYVPVTPGIRQAGSVELVDSSLTGEVVTLGHQQVKDGSAVRVVGRENGLARDEAAEADEEGAV